MEPIYRQICLQLKNAIITGKLQNGDTLPSIRALADELKISTITIRHAYAQLEKEGFLITVAGKGSYVAPTNNSKIKKICKEEIRNDLEEVAMLARVCNMSTLAVVEMFQSIKDRQEL